AHAAGARRLGRLPSHREAVRAGRRAPGRGGSRIEDRDGGAEAPALRRRWRQRARGACRRAQAALQPAMARSMNATPATEAAAPIVLRARLERRLRSAWRAAANPAAATTNWIAVNPTR